MLLRSLVVGASLVFSAAAQAVLIQVYAKSLSTGGNNEYVCGVTLDATGNAYVVSYYGSTPTATALVRKYSITGATLWTRVLNDPGDTDVKGRNLVLDASSNLYVTTFHASTNSLKLKKLRGSDGLVLGSLSPSGEVSSSLDASKLTVDASGHVYWALAVEEVGSSIETLKIYNINPSAVNLSSYRSVPMPVNASVVHAQPRPGGGVMITAGVGLRVSPEPPVFASNLYSFSYTGGPKIIPMGYGAATAWDPLTGDVVYVGGSRHGNVYRHRGPADQIPEIGATTGINIYPVSIRDVTVTKKGVVVAVGSYYSSSSQVDSLAATYNSETLDAGPITIIPGTSSEQDIHRVEADYYDGLTATERRSALELGIHELDVTATAPINSRIYTMANLALGGFHQKTLPLGLTLCGAGNRLVLVKPRDFKDMYMGSTAYRGGSSATLIIRMYEPHTISRAVILTDNSPNVSMPSSKSISANQSTTSVVVNTSPVTTPQYVTLTGKYGAQVRTFSFTLNP